jgi:hypothetical protein
MMEEQKFWDIIETTLGHSTLEDDIAYDEFLHNQLMQKQVKDIIGFQLRLIELRRGLDSFEVIKTAHELNYYPSREVFNRFCNGLVASGREFYYKVKDKPGHILKLLEEDPKRLRYCYYEGFSLIAPNVFYEKEGHDADILLALANQNRISELKKDKDTDIGHEL